MLLQALLALVPFVLAVPHSQSPFALSSSLLPAQDSVAFINHTLIPLQDGTFVPSPAFGVGGSHPPLSVSRPSGDVADGLSYQDRGGTSRMSQRLY